MSTDLIVRVNVRATPTIPVKGQVSREEIIGNGEERYLVAVR